MSMTIATPIHLLVYPLALQHVKQAHYTEKRRMGTTVLSSISALMLMFQNTPVTCFFY